ncbi:MAG: DEAD/DEAH box helicase, partial [Culicoidibacterales bacterium]
MKTAIANGSKSPCLVSPCGSGKSIITAEIAKSATNKQNRVLFLVHRKELCEQISETFTNYGVNMELCDIQMVQTACRRLHSAPEYQLIITDESHHSLANSYKKIYDHHKKTLRINVTATPIRLGGKGLGETCDKLIETITVDELIEKQALVDFEYYAPRVFNPKNLKLSKGDFDAKEISEAFEKKAIFGDVVKEYRELANNKQAIVYTHSIEASKKIVMEFNNNSICAAHVDGTTPKKERAEIIEKFRIGEIKILSNLDILAEGFDVPNCECVILMRPTMSLSLHIQQSMRSMRFKPNKKAIIIDCVGNVFRHGLPTTIHEWSLADKPKKIKKSGDETKIFECEKCFLISERTTSNVC